MAEGFPNVTERALGICETSYSKSVETCEPWGQGSKAAKAMATAVRGAGYKAPRAIPSAEQAALLCSCSILHAWCTLAQKHHPHFQILEGGELFFPLFGCPLPVRGLTQDGCVPGAEWCSGWAPRFWSKTPGVKPCLYS